ncbi:MULTISPECIES: DinB family protein [Bacillus]|uniref:DinB-like domain-containing protein n=2 Tax=Bacillus TaxID=1386 RepID=A0A0M5JGC9_9BACI|nr:MULTISPECIES: DinB family protein [Bacillus]ALC81289.1 hypothetical protein AM592_06555 [Bacillus gobiensis]MBP1080299.1 putative damage-inducible protein DinB [Bacillus capparidis]MED1094162.1 DinB family protein [Bacillus capparidis]
MPIKQLLINQLVACCNESSWFVCYSDAVKNLTEEEACMKPSSPEHSIKEISYHLFYWNERYLKRWKGEQVAENALPFAETFHLPAEASWEEIKHNVIQIFSEWIDELQNCDEQQLLEQVAWSNSTWSDEISYLTIHSAYHIGQIVTARKRQNSWKNEYGV